jgi:PucR C-terminal helix-turn-helix domain
MLTRVFAVSDPSKVADPGYAAGLRETVGAALDYGIAGVEAGEERPPAPPQILAQARAAARNQVRLDTVLRRYFAGYSLLADFLIEEAQGSGLLQASELQGLLRTISALFDVLIVAVAREYGEEADNRVQSSEQRRTERVRRLLAGELFDTSDLHYEIEGWHLGVVASRSGSPNPLRELACAVDCSLLSVVPDDTLIWGWLGARHKRGSREVLDLATSGGWPAGALLVLGEPGHGPEGWRATHRQALAALPVAQRGPERVIRHVDVALLAAALRDEVLASTLQETYIRPLTHGPDGGKVLKETLTAYLSAGRQVSSTAATLNVSRQTVNSRLRSVEVKIDRSIQTCAAELETALRLHNLSTRQFSETH